MPRGWFCAAALLCVPLLSAHADPLPRVAVLTDVRVDGKPGDGGGLLDAVNEVLLNAGFPLVAPDRLKAVRQTIDLEGALNGKLPSELSALDVDLIVIARGAADQLHGTIGEGHQTRFFGSKVTVTVVRADTAQIAAALHANGHAADLSTESAAQKSLENAVGKLAPELTRSLMALAAAPHSIELVVHGVPDRAAVRRLIEAWGGAGLPALSERYFGLGLARFELTTKDPGQRVANQVDAERLPLEVIAASQTRIATRYAPSHNVQVETLFTPPQLSGGAPGWLSDTVGELVFMKLSELGFVRLSRIGLDEGEARQLAKGKRQKVAAALLRPTKARAVVLTQLFSERNELRLNLSVLGRHGETLAFASARGAKGDPAAIATQALAQLEPALIAKAGAAELNTAPRLRVVAGRVQDLFPAQVNRYAQHPAAELQLHTDGTLAFSEVRVQAQLPGLMALPTEVTVGTLQPGEDKKVPLPLALDPAALAQLDQSRAAGLQVTVRYRVDGLDGAETRVLPVVLHGRHEIDWREPGSVAAFVTAQDPAIRAFANEAIAAAGGAGLSPRIQAAVAIHQALTTASLRYVKDPEIAWGSTPLDSVSLPRETLASGSGDCDDQSVLYAALLESVGVPTAFLLTPGHILVAFDTGLPASRGATLSIDPGRTLAHDGALWVPVETTLVGEDFERAWAAGAREAASSKTDWVPVHRSWSEYPPTALSASVLPRPLQKDAASAAVRRGAGELAQARAAEQRRAVDALFAKLRSHPREAKVRAQLVETLALGGRYDEAVKAAGNSDDPQVALDRGNALLLQGNAKEALAAYGAAQGELGPRARFNAGVARRALGALTEAAADFRAAAAGGLSQDIARLLGAEQNARAADTAGMDPEVRKLLEGALAKAAAVKPKPGEQEQPPPELLPSAGRRGADASDRVRLEELLYWAP